MATRFAVASTSWNTPSTWDNGAVPLPGDTVYPNGFTIPIDTDISVDSLNNNVSPIYLPNMCIPKMTGNNQPSGTAFASSNASGFDAFEAFDQLPYPNAWSSAVLNSGIIGYQFTSGKIIKRYYVSTPAPVSSQGIPKTWTFEGSNDGINYFILDTVSTNVSPNYISVLLGNTTSYIYYRLNITASGNASAAPVVTTFEMTESVGTQYGQISGGSFTVPSSLVGTRNIEFTGAGLQSYASFSSNLLTLDNNLTNTVNINKTAGAYIINPLFNGTANSSSGATAININNNGIVNINGDIYGTTLVDGAAPLGLIRIVSNSTVTVNGNLYPLAGRSNVASYIINLLPTSTNATLTINGSIFGGNLYSNTYSIFVQAVGTININGNLTSNSGYCIFGTGSIFLNITGIVSFTNASSVGAISLGGNAAVNVTGAVSAPPNFSAIVGGGGAINVLTGIVTAGTNAVGINAASASLVTVGNSPIINSNNFMAIYAPRIRFYTGAQVEWTFQTSTGGTKVLRNADGSSGLPSYIHVKIGQPYGPNNDIIGACVIPPANTVGVGIPVSTIVPINQPVPTTVGTLQLTGEDLLNAISTSSNVVAERLRNVSTVDTTGNQIVALS